MSGQAENGGMADRVFTAFDYDHDASLRTLLVGQSRRVGIHAARADVFDLGFH